MAKYDPEKKFTYQSDDQVEVEDSQCKSCKFNIKPGILKCKIFEPKPTDYVFNNVTCPGYESL